MSLRTMDRQDDIFDFDGVGINLTHVFPRVCELHPVNEEVPVTDVGPLYGNPLVGDDSSGLQGQGLGSVVQPHHLKKSIAHSV